MVASGSAERAIMPVRARYLGRRRSYAPVVPTIPMLLHWGTGAATFIGHPISRRRRHASGLTCPQVHTVSLASGARAGLNARRSDTGSGSATCPPRGSNTTSDGENLPMIQGATA